MKKNVFYGIMYVSILIIIWGTIGSLVDFQLLEKGIYQEGSIGQISTFLVAALITAIFGKFFFPQYSSRFNNIEK